MRRYFGRVLLPIFPHVWHSCIGVSTATCDTIWRRYSGVCEIEKPVHLLWLINWFCEGFKSWICVSARWEVSEPTMKTKVLRLFDALYCHLDEVRVLRFKGKLGQCSGLLWYLYCCADSLS